MATLLQWVARLQAKIERQATYAAPYEARYRNEYVLPWLIREYREVYGASVDTITPGLQPPSTGIAAIGIDALVERLTIDSIAGPDGARDAVRIVQEAWEANDLDVMHREAHREALIKARSFGYVARDASGQRAVVGIESSEQMAVERQMVPPYDIAAALKIRKDEWTGDHIAVLEVPGFTATFEHRAETHEDPEGSDVCSNWWLMDDGVVATRLPWVPVVEFASRPRLLVEPVSEIEPIASLVDIADLVEGLMVFAGHFGAVPIRFATGLEIPRDPADPSGRTPLLGPDGKPAIGFNPRADHLWVSTSKDAEFGQLTPAGLDSFVSWAEHVSIRIRAKTSIPSSYYGTNAKTHMSAELLKTDEAPMVRRVLSMGQNGAFNQAWRRLCQLVLMIEAPLTVARVAPHWSDPQTRVEAQAVDSFQKAVASGLGVVASAMEFLGWDREKAEAAAGEGAAQRRVAAVQAEALFPLTGEGEDTAPLLTSTPLVVA